MIVIAMPNLHVRRRLNVLRKLTIFTSLKIGIVIVGIPFKFLHSRDERKLSQHLF